MVIWVTRKEMCVLKIDDKESIGRLRDAMNEDFRQRELTMSQLSTPDRPFVNYVIFYFDDGQTFAYLVVSNGYLIYKERYYEGHRTLAMLESLRSEGKATPVGRNEAMEILPETYRGFAGFAIPVSDD